MNPADAKDQAPGAIRRTLLQRTDVLGMPGWETRVYLVEYPPGVAAPVHTHPMPGIGYVLSGRVESAFRGEAPVTYSAGESFVDEALSPHTVSRNPDGERPFQILLSYTIPKGVATVAAPR